MRFVALVGALVALLHAGLWALTQERVAAPNFDGQLASVSYTPFDGSAHPDSGTRTSVAQIRADLKAIAPYTRTVRTYSSTGGSELVPTVADEFGLRTSIGAWIDKDARRNERELRSVIELGRRHRNVDSIVVGNETIFRGEQKVDELIRKIQRVKRETGLPVTTGEIWHAWIEHPELASAVDFIAAHVLPYWEGHSEASAVDQAVRIYNTLRQAYPGKRVVIAEFGWPSAGYNRRDANPGRTAQAQVLRDFVTRAEALGIDYNIIEAYDQPWKTFEGGVGPYWGMFDTSREPKFNWTGPITNPDHWKLAGLALLIGVLLSLPILALGGATVGQAALLASAAHVVGAWFTYIFAFWNGHYFVLGTTIAFALGLLLLVPLILIALARVEEIAAIAFGRKPRRLIAAPPLVPELSSAPKVSIHVPAHMEPPEMLKQTLDALARLDYPNYECVIVVNNTPDPALWRPIEEHCATLGERFKFIHDDHVVGYKAGALRLALARTAPDAEIIGVLDADYVVHPDWLKDLVPVFGDAKVGLVQAPQDHRDSARSVMHHAMNGEYSGFFDIGMVQRNEANAIIVHGTMCLIRRAALEAAGGWSSDTIVEDTDLGLSILELGWLAHYTNRRYGHGLLPDNFLAYKRQRHRWAYGGFQILKKHWRVLLPGSTGLQREQKREFALGWLNWLGAEALGVLVALLNLVWAGLFLASQREAFRDTLIGNAIAIPDAVLMLPILAAFAVSLTHFVALYRLRVAVPLGQMLGALFAAMSVQWTVARAVGFGLVKDHLPFVRTAKGSSRRSADFPAFWEGVIAALLVGSAIVVHATNWERVREIDLFAIVLLVQSLPFLASLGLAALESSRANDFAAWSALEGRLAGVLSRQPAAVGATVTAIAETPAVADKRVEPAQ
jgi:exo-beta-1,3-glucanase (GH17 family)/cellulose synthase/poly-beta-1,6-N-acetylglucosamine synthase-like glycosyltransferase